MERRQFLRLGAVASGVFALGGISRVARGTGAARRPWEFRPWNASS